LSALERQGIQLFSLLCKKKIMVKIQLVLKRVFELFSSLRVFGKGKSVPHTPIPRGKSMKVE